MSQMKTHIVLIGVPKKDHCSYIFWVHVSAQTPQNMLWAKLFFQTCWNYQYICIINVTDQGRRCIPGGLWLHVHCDSGAWRPWAPTGSWLYCNAPQNTAGSAHHTLLLRTGTSSHTPILQTQTEINFKGMVWAFFLTGAKFEAGICC